MGGIMVIHRLLARASLATGLAWGWACGDGPLAFEPGDALVFTARTEEHYDCAPGLRRDPADPAICGSRSDTIVLPGYSLLEARFTVVEVRNTTPQTEPGDPPSSVVQADRLTAGGEMLHSRCADDCEVLSRNEVQIQVDRAHRECRGLNSPPECGGRSSGSVVLVIVALTDPPVFLTGVQDDSGRMEGVLQDAPFFSRMILRTTWSLTRD
jgi:hypothetical protein